MRLFVAADVDADTRAEIVRLRTALRARLLDLPSPPRVGWIRDDQMHLTLRFLGEQTDAAADRIRAALGPGLPIPAFDLRLARLGTFPSGRRPRVIWLGSDDDAGAQAVTALADAVRNRLVAIAGSGDARATRAHVTIGRVRDAGVRVDWPAVLAVEPVAATCTRIDQVTLYRSQLSPRGATYTALCRANLRP